MSFQIINIVRNFRNLNVLIEKSMKLAPRTLSKKQLSMSHNYGTVQYSKPAINEQVGRRKIQYNAKEKDEIIGQKNKGIKEFIIEDFKAENAAEVKELIAKNYSARNPLRTMLHMTNEDEMEMLDVLIPERVGNKVSFVARDQNTKKIVGTCLPKIHLKSDKISTSKYKNNSIKVQHLLHVVEVLSTSINFFDKYNVDKILEMSMTAIDPKFSGKRLLNVMINETFRRAKEHEYKLMITLSTHPIVEAQCRNFGGTMEFELDFDSIEIDGRKILDLEKKVDISSFKVFSIQI